MRKIRGRRPSPPGPGMTLVCAAAIWLAVAGNSSAQISSSPGGTVLEIHGTRRVERSLAPAVADSPVIRNAPENVSFPPLAPSVPLSSRRTSRNPAPAEPAYSQPADPLSGIDGPITLSPAFPVPIVERGMESLLPAATAVPRDGGFTDRPAGLAEEATTGPLADTPVLMDERTSPLAASERPGDSPAAAVSSDSAIQTTQQPALQPYPIVIQDRGAWPDPWFVTWGVIAISALVGSFLLSLFWLLLALRRLSALQNATIRIELADSDSASLRLLANRLHLTASGGGDAALANTGGGGPPAASMDPRGTDAGQRSANPPLSLAQRPTQVVDLAEAPFPAAWAGPTFADTMQADQKRRRAQEEEILRTIFDRNLELVEKLR